LYIKVEEGAVVTARYKYVRASFSTTVLQSDGHWLNRPIIPNLLRPGIDLFQSWLLLFLNRYPGHFPGVPRLQTGR
jgi:hypothetical protein